MAAEAFTIIGAVSATLSVLNIVKGWVTELIQLTKDYKNAGETLLELYINFDKCQTELDIWMRMWGVEKPTSRRYQRELWGSRGMHTLAMQMTSVNSISESIRDELAPYSRSTNMPRLAEEGESKVGLASMSAPDFRMEAKKTKKGLSIKETAAFVISKGPRMLGDLSRLREKIIDL